MSVRGWSLITAAIASLSLAACGSSGTRGSSSGGKQQFTIGVSNPLASNPTLSNWQKAVELKAKQLGMHVTVVDANFDPGKQLSDLNTLIDEGVNAIILTPLDENAVLPALERAKQKGIAIIGWEGANAPPYDVNLNATNVEAGMQAALTIARKVGKGAKVAAIDGVPQVQILKDRSTGFTEGAKEAGLQIVARQVNLKDNADGAQPIVAAWKSKYGSSLAGIWAYNDPSAFGAASVVGGNFRPTIIGMNASIEGIDAVRRGQILATWDQRPIDAGNGAVWAAYEILTKHKLPQRIQITMPRYELQNVSQWRTPEQLLQGPEGVSVRQQGDGWFLEITPPGP